MKSFLKLIRKHLRMIILLLILFFIIIVVIPIRFTFMITHNSFKNPDVFTNPKLLFKIEYEDIELTTSDGLRLKGWLVKSNENNATVILCHGFFATMDDMVDCIPFLYQAGYNVLAFDFRNHGRSEGKITTLGYYERADLKSAMNFILKRNDLSHKIVIWGKSMGAAVALLEAPENPHIRGIIAESSFLSFKQTMAHHAKLLYGLPPFPMVNLTIFWLKVRTGADFDKVDIINAVKKLDDKPVLFIGSEADQRMIAKDARILYENCSSKYKELWITKEGEHGGIFDANKDEYEKRVTEFLNKTKYEPL